MGMCVPKFVKQMGLQMSLDRFLKPIDTFFIEYDSHDFVGMAPLMIQGSDMPSALDAVQRLQDAMSYYFSKSYTLLFIFFICSSLVLVVRVNGSWYINKLM